MSRGQRVLLFMHLGWMIVVLSDALLLAVSVPVFFALVHRPCSSSATSCLPAQLSLVDFQALGGPGPALNTYAVYALVTVVTAALVWGAVGALIAWRKWNDPMMLFVSMVLITNVPDTITFGATPTITFGAPSRIHVPEVLALSGPVISVLGIAANELFYPALAVFRLTFPTGRFAPRWSAVLVLPWIAQDLLFFLNAPFAAIQACIYISLGSAAAVQVYRYVRRYTPIQRQQTKWIVFAFAFVSLPLVAGYAVAPMLWPVLNMPGSAYRLADIAILMVIPMLIALSVGVSILRHRLYDIDVIIRRTLIYGTLSTILVAVYLALVYGGQHVLASLLGSNNTVVVVVSTLIVLVLFRPLRQRVQQAVDRRFYRSTYDATQVVARFGETLRQEVNLEQLSAHLLATVQETVQPAHLSLWLRVNSPPRTLEPREGQPGS